MGTKSDNAVWFRGKNDAKHVTQIVAVVPAQNVVPPRVGNLIPGGAPGVAFLKATWATTAVLLDGDTPEKAGPFLFSKATHVVEVLKGQPVTIAFAYYKFLSAGLFQIFVEVDNSMVRSRINDRYVSERLFNLDDTEDLDLIRRLCSREILEVCFVAPGTMGPCTGHFGLSAAVPKSVRSALLEELDSLISYHNGLQSRNAEHAVAQYNSENPMENTPVLWRDLERMDTKVYDERQTEVSPGNDGGFAPRKAHPWWRFW
jgi:hypothetical protein